MKKDFVNEGLPIDELDDSELSDDSEQLKPKFIENSDFKMALEPIITDFGKRAYVHQTFFQSGDLSYQSSIYSCSTYVEIFMSLLKSLKI